MLFLVSGAPGSGKTTIVPELAAQADGVAILDMDDLLEDGHHLGIPIATPDAAPIWPAYNRLWLRLTRAVGRSGIPVVLFCPLLPREAEAAGLDGTDDARWGLLDCADAERERRLRGRGWNDSEVAGAIEDAEQARRVISTRFATDLATPSETAAEVLQWVVGCRRAPFRATGSA